MISFLLSVAILIVGYFVYGKYIDRVFSSDKDRPTPAISSPDGVDCVPLSTKRVFLIQFLNIAGLGPIFGAIMGAMYGPVVFLWITLGGLFGGTVHDYFSGMISVREKGASIPDIYGLYLGKYIKQISRFLIVLLMVMVGAVFTSGPAGILESITNGGISSFWWGIIIFVYYIVATLFPIDKVIGKIYPIFGAALLFMTGGALLFMIISGDVLAIPEVSFHNFHPSAETLPIFPFIFVSVACGAVSGGHATMSPLMARCITNEKDGRKVFFGAMIVESFVCLIWAAVGMCFFDGLGGLHGFMAANGNNAAVVVSAISKEYLGLIGGTLAMLGVVAAPVTSADTGFRAARLILAETFHVSQKKFLPRLLIALPLFLLCLVILNADFSILWRYFSWTNQLLSVITLWFISVYLSKLNKNYFISLVPAVFMSMVCFTYIIIAKEGFSISYYPGIACATVCTSVLVLLFFRFRKLSSRLS